MNKFLMAAMCAFFFLLGALSFAVWVEYNHECVLEIITQEPATIDKLVPDPKVIDTSYSPDATLLPTRGGDPKVDPHKDRRFSKKFPVTRDINEIRNDDFGTGTSKKILIYEHKGGVRLDVEKIERTIRAVTQRMPNLRTTDELISLFMETLWAETDLGAEKHEVSIRKYGNYGIAQLRKDTTKETLSWLKKVRPDVYEQVMSLNNPKYDLEWNITYNVPFSLAIMMQYYWRRCPDIYNHIQTKVQRAELWKSEYNSHKGLGTVAYYLKRNKDQ